jgi:DNA mismatch endonuclease (patch repair protein)
MSDVFSSSKRSEVMARIRSRGNKSTEHALIAILRENEIKGWRRHQAVLGRPDFIFRQRKLAVFVDGCFWHGCPRCYHAPRQNREFWKSKLNANRKRDKTVSAKLRASGWTVVRIWEHQLANKSAVASRIKRVFGQCTMADGHV